GAGRADSRSWHGAAGRNRPGASLDPTGHGSPAGRATGGNPPGAIGRRGNGGAGDPGGPTGILSGLSLRALTGDPGEPALRSGERKSRPGVSEIRPDGSATRPRSNRRAVGPTLGVRL